MRVICKVEIGNNKVVTLMFERHSTGNFIAKWGNQQICVLPRPFIRITGVSERAVIGTIYCDIIQLTELGFYVVETRDYGIA